MFLLDLVPSKPELAPAPENTIMDMLSQPQTVIAIVAIALAVIAICVTIVIKKK